MIPACEIYSNTTGLGQCVPDLPRNQNQIKAKEKVSSPASTIFSISPRKHIVVTTQGFSTSTERVRTAPECGHIADHHKVDVRPGIDIRLDDLKGCNKYGIEGAFDVPPKSHVTSECVYYDYSSTNEEGILTRKVDLMHAGASSGGSPRMSQEAPARLISVSNRSPQLYPLSRARSDTMPEQSNQSFVHLECGSGSPPNANDANSNGYEGYKRTDIYSTDLPNLIRAADMGLKCGLTPVLATGALGGTYFLRGGYGHNASVGMDGDCIESASTNTNCVAVFKPWDQEPNAMNNPYSTPSRSSRECSGTSMDSSKTNILKFDTDLKFNMHLDSPGVLTHKVGNIVPGFGMYRELAAYILDNSRSHGHLLNSIYCTNSKTIKNSDSTSFAGIPPTALARVQHPVFQTKQWEVNKSECGPLGYSGDINAEEGKHGSTSRDHMIPPPLSNLLSPSLESLDRKRPHDLFSQTFSNNLLHMERSTAVPDPPPLTIPLTPTSSAPHMVSKIGAIQAFVRSQCTAEDMGSSMFATMDVLRIAILDLRVCNLDRHEGNLLVCTRELELASGNSVSSNGVNRHVDRQYPVPLPPPLSPMIHNAVSTPIAIPSNDYQTVNKLDHNPNPFPNLWGLSRSAPSRPTSASPVPNTNPNYYPGSQTLVRTMTPGGRPSKYTLVPIDHGYCLPHILAIEEASLAWVYWPQVSLSLQELSRLPLYRSEPGNEGNGASVILELIDYISSLDYEEDVRVLQHNIGISLPSSSLMTLFVCTSMLKIGVLDYQCSLKQIGELYSCNYDPLVDSDVDGRESTTDVLCPLQRMVNDTIQRVLYQFVQHLIDVSDWNASISNHSFPDHDPSMQTSTPYADYVRYHVRHTKHLPWKTPLLELLGLHPEGGQSNVSFNSRAALQKHPLVTVNNEAFECCCCLMAVEKSVVLNNLSVAMDYCSAHGSCNNSVASSTHTSPRGSIDDNHTANTHYRMNTTGTNWISKSTSNPGTKSNPTSSSSQSTYGLLLRSEFERSIHMLYKSLSSRK